MRHSLPFLLLLLLAACSGPKLPFEKDGASDSAAVRPPWEALVQAGPGAEKDLDLETLDGPLPRVSAPVSAAEVPPQTQENATPPAQKAGTPPKAGKTGTVIKAVAVPSVTGAKGRGNGELTAAMRHVLQEAGWPVLASRRPDALLITGKATLGPVTGDTQKVKLVWTVASPDGKTLGQIVQENAMPAGSLDKSWGENAQFATEAAAEGIFKLIQGFR